MFELAVVLLLVGFGVRAIHQGVYTRADAPDPYARQPTPARRRISVGGRSAGHCIVGAVHGLAGSGALTALVVAELPSTLTRLSYLALFGIGTTAGMAVLSGLVGWPLAKRGGPSVDCARPVGGRRRVSTVLGLVWGYPLVAGWL